MTRLFQRPLNEIDEADLNGMIGKPMFRESQSIDYKRCLTNLGQREPKKEFIKDITAMANSFGGVLMIGVSEESGIPNSLDGQDTSTIGIQHKDIDKLKTSLQEIIISNTEPRLAGVSIHQVTLKNGNNVIIFEIPKSPLLPHRSTLDNQFYYRYDTLSRAMSMDEVRALITNAESFHDKLERFRQERIKLISEGRTPVLLFDNPKTVIHIIPATALSGNEEYDLQQLKYAIQLPLSGAGQANPLHVPSLKGNLSGSEELLYDSGEYFEDGFIASNSRTEDKSTAYTTVYNSGIIETVDSVHIRPKDMNYGRGIRHFIFLDYFEKIVQAIQQTFVFLHALGISPPLWVTISLLHIKDYKIPYYDQPSITEQPYGHHIKNENIVPLAVPIESFDSNIGKSIKPVFDKIWQAAGYSNAFLDEDGKIIR